MGANTQPVPVLSKNDVPGVTLHKPEPVTCKNTRTSLSKPVDNAGQVMDPRPTMLSLNDHMILWLITGLATLLPEVSVTAQEDPHSRLPAVILVTNRTSLVNLLIIPSLICQAVV